MFPSQVAPRPRVSGAPRQPRFALFLALGLLTAAPLTLFGAPSAVAPLLVAAPHNPSENQLELLRRARASGPQPFATSTPLSVDTASREATRQFYLAVYSAANDVPAQWTGNVSTGIAGDTSAAFKNAVILRINALRAFAGVPAGITLNPTYSTKNQQAALMMSANNSLSHTPPSSWTYYTADGAEAAYNSNLSLGNYGPSAITRGYLADPGTDNYPVGHRRWLLYPQTREMGTGDVTPSSPSYSANATWVVDGYFGTTRPATREAFVAWPAKGYAPAPLIFPRWSFSYPGANFANATVTMTDGNAASIPVMLEPLAANIGDPTLAWIYNNLSADDATPLTVTNDQTYHVTVSNVVVGGTPRSFSYDVIAFDPQRSGSDTVPVTVTGPSTPAVGAANTYSATAPSFATSVEWRSLQFDSGALPVFGAESGLDGATATTTGTYGGRSTSTVGAGSASYQLATPTFDDQFITLPDTFYASATGTPALTFLSRLGFATTGQIARVQISTDEGSSWLDAYTQTGTGSGGESGFVSRDISLATFAGLTFRIRFAYTWTPGISVFTQTAAGVGWFFDRITLTGVQRVGSASTPAAASGTSFSFTPSAAGAYGLQARGVLFASYPMAWGPVTLATASAAPAFTTQPASQSAAAGGSITLTTAATGSTSLRWQRNGSDVAGATSPSLTLSNLAPASTGLYTALATNPAGTTTSNSAIVGVTTGSKVIGAGEIVGEDIHHANGNIFDQVLLNGAAEAITADYAQNQITRTSFVDLDKDIVQVEFSGPGTLSLVLLDATAPAPPEYYNQSVLYVKGHAGIVITGADERTNVSVFSVGRTTAVNQALFKDNVTYDGIADLAFIAISSTNGKFGGVRTANANFFASQGLTGLYAPGVEFQGPVFIGDITAFDNATPVIKIGAAKADTRITGGDLFQDNGRAVQVSGLTQLKFTDGGDSHGKLLPAQHNRAVLQQDGQDVTAQIVVNPTP